MNGRARASGGADTRVASLQYAAGLSAGTAISRVGARGGAVGDCTVGARAAIVRTEGPRGSVAGDTAWTAHGGCPAQAAHCAQAGAVAGLPGGASVRTGAAVVSIGGEEGTGGGGPRGRPG